MQLCSIAQVLVVVALPRLSPLSSTVLALAVTLCVPVDRRGQGRFHFVEGGYRCGRVCEPSCHRVCRRWALLLVSGSTHRIRVVVV